MTPYERRRHQLARDLGDQVSHERIWACLSKQRYPDEAVARAATSVHLESGVSDAVELWVHRCEHCRGWHTTKRRQPGPSVTAGDVFHEDRR